MAEGNFGVMELLEKLFKERGKGVSKDEQGILGQYEGTPIRSGEGSGYQSFIDKSKMKAGDNYQAGEMQLLDPLANTTQVGNATTPALDKMRDLQTGAGAVSNNELQNFKIGASSVDDNALGGYVTHNMPNLTRMGMDHLDRNLPPHELRRQINAMTAQPQGAMSGNDLQNFKIASQYVDDGALSGWLTQMMPALQQMGVGSFDINLPPNELRNVVDAISTGRFGGVSDNEMDRGNPSNVDRSFAQALGALSDREQAEIISATQGMTTDEQIDNFKRQYLQGRISPYELEAQSNLGF